ncbi:hypothetical protein GW916_15040 [bacterium]|nr:hypothetical protein [bacterium]
MTGFSEHTKGLSQLCAKLVRMKGQSLVEFAIILPLLILIIMGIVDFGWLLHQQIQIDAAARAGGRRGAVGASNEEIMGIIKSECPFVSDEDIKISIVQPDGTETDNADRTADNFIIVNISKEVRFITPVIVPFGPIEIRSNSKFLIE